MKIDDWGLFYMNHFSKGLFRVSMEYISFVALYEIVNVYFRTFRKTV